MIICLHDYALPPTKKHQALGVSVVQPLSDILCANCLSAKWMMTTFWNWIELQIEHGTDLTLGFGELALHF